MRRGGEEAGVFKDSDCNPEGAASHKVTVHSLSDDDRQRRSKHVAVPLTATRSPFRALTGPNAIRPMRATGTVFKVLAARDAVLAAD